LYDFEESLTPVAAPELGHALNITDIVARFDRPGHFDPDVSLCHRIRGALGYALFEMQANETDRQKKRRALYDLPSSYELFFGAAVVPPRVLPLPIAPTRPFVLFADFRCEKITVRLRLFGAARLFTREIKQALAQALETLGITVAPLARSKARISPLEIMLETPCPKPLHDLDKRNFRLIFVTPARIQTGNWSSLTVRNLASSWVSRISGALYWCNGYLDLDTDIVRNAQENMAISELDTKPVHWSIYSKRSGCRRTEMGISGAISLKGVPQPLLFLFPTLELLGMGVGTAKGFGRVAFIPE